jgi:translation initiation factor 2 subunit 1
MHQAKAVHSILRHVAELRKTSLEELYRTVGWPLHKKYGHAHDAFKLCLSQDEDQQDVFAGLEIDESTKSELTAYIQRRLAPQPIKIRGDIEVTCYTYEGVDAIRESLTAGIAVGSSVSVLCCSTTIVLVL